MRLAAACAVSGSVPAAIAACAHPSLLPVMNALPSGEVANAISSGLGLMRSREMEREAKESHLPTDADRARSVCVPVWR